MSTIRGFSYEHNPDTQRTESPRSYSEPSAMASFGDNSPDIISHQPTSGGSPGNNNINNSTAPWTYVPSGSIPLQRQDFHSSIKSLNINGYSSMDTAAAVTPDTTATDDDAKRRVSCTMSQLSTPPSPAPTIPAPGTAAFGSRDWSSDLFEPFRECRKTKPVSSSLKKFFRDCMCVPCMMCDIAKSLGDKTCLPFIPGTGAAIRFKVRILGGIQGTIADDCLVTSCCCACAVCQMYREIDDIGLATR